MLGKILTNSLKKVIIAENDLKGQSATKIFGNWLNPKFTVFELKKELFFGQKRGVTQLRHYKIVILMKKMTSYIAKLL